jgi:tRNA A37 threonylcarbamoyladenosine modification protein TsaB
VRSAIALALGWQLGRGSRLLGIGSMNSLAARAKQTGWRGEIHMVVDAQRNEFYLASYTLTDQTQHIKTPVHLVSWNEIQAAREKGEVLIGPDITRWFPEGNLLFPQASSSALLAAQEPDWTLPPPLEPVYLRPTQFVKALPPRTWD